MGAAEKLNQEKSKKNSAENNNEFQSRMIQQGSVSVVARELAFHECSVGSIPSSRPLWVCELNYCLSQCYWRILRLFNFNSLPDLSEINIGSQKQKYFWEETCYVVKFCFLKCETFWHLQNSNF